MCLGTFISSSENLIFFLKDTPFIADFYSDSDYDDGDPPAPLPKTREVGGGVGGCTQGVAKSGCSPDSLSVCVQGCCAPYPGQRYGYPGQYGGGDSMAHTNTFRLSRKIFTNHR